MHTLAARFSTSRGSHEHSEAADRSERMPDLCSRNAVVLAVCPKLITGQEDP